MKPSPTGRLVPTPTGADLVIERIFRAPIDDVWESVTASDSTARWFGRWEGEPGPGKMIRVQMGFEKGTPWFDMHIDACEPPRHFAVSTKDDHGEWHLELTLTTVGDTTKLTFTQHLDDPKLAGDAGPGWEYYLDMLVAARTGQPAPSFDDYYPSQRAHYLGEST
jgi:uncharacterized protein YndB with AHSA1/START domain